jgi:hypothetical protein
MTETLGCVPPRQLPGCQYGRAARQPPVRRANRLPTDDTSARPDRGSRPGSAQPGSSAVVRSPAMKKPVWAVTGPVIAVARLARAGLAVRGRSS